MAKSGQLFFKISVSIWQPNTGGEKRSKLILSVLFSCSKLEWTLKKHLAENTPSESNFSQNSGKVRTLLLLLLSLFVCFLVFLQIFLSCFILSVYNLYKVTQKKEIWCNKNQNFLENR